MRNVNFFSIYNVRLPGQTCIYKPLKYIHIECEKNGCWKITFSIKIEKKRISKIAIGLYLYYITEYEVCQKEMITSI